MKYIIFSAIIFLSLSGHGNSECAPTTVFGNFGSGRGGPGLNPSFQDVFSSMESLRLKTQLKIDQNRLRDLETDFTEEEQLFNRGIRTQSQYEEKRYELRRTRLQVKKSQWSLEKSHLRKLWNKERSQENGETSKDLAKDYSKRFWAINFDEVKTQKEIFDLEVAHLKNRIGKLDRLNEKGFVPSSEVDSLQRQMRDARIRSQGEFEHLKIINRAGCLEKVFKES